MPRSTSLSKNFALRDAHRVAQKISLLFMAMWLLACQRLQALVKVAMPDAVMVMIIVGLIAYVTVNYVVRTRTATNNYSEDEWLHAIDIVDPQ